MAAISDLNNLARVIELHVLASDATRQDLERACGEAREHGFYSVCVNGSRVSLAVAQLEDSGVKVATVVGFPLGAMEADAKRFDTEVAVDNGAQEIQVVLNIGLLKDGEDAAILRELRDVVEAADERPVGVILEVPLFTVAEKIRACELMKESGAKWAIGSAGRLSAGAIVDDVKLLRESLGQRFGVGASGVIEDRATALALIKAGATRLATNQALALLRDISKIEN